MLAYCEGQGQELSYYVIWLTGKGFTPNCTDIWLPHDGTHGDKVFATSYEKALRDAGYHVRVVPDQGKGAALKRVEAARRLFPQIHFNEPECWKRWAGTTSSAMRRGVLASGPSMISQAMAPMPSD